jgi:hypothetical protein
MKLTSLQVKNSEHTTLKSDRMQKLIEIFQRFVAREGEWMVLRKDAHQNALFQMQVQIHPLMQEMDTQYVFASRCKRRGDPEGLGQGTKAMVEYHVSLRGTKNS